MISNALFSLLEKLISQPEFHCLWLNTLSFWENCGARKLAACEHPTKVKEEMLKHAAEEFRHAHQLKQQIHRIKAPYPIDYSWANLVGGIQAYHYVDRLEMGISRLLVEQGYSKDKYRSLNYLLMSYAIEKRAEEVYTLYHHSLQRAHSPVRIYSILLEEKEHLAEVIEELNCWPGSSTLCTPACQLESEIHAAWLAVALS